MKSKRYFNYFIIYFLFPVIIIFVMHYGMKDIMNIHIASDEFGYWTAAADILGFDWSQCASLNGYYSFGYGIILAPLLLFKSPNLAYKVALYINIVFVVLSYFEVMKVIQNLFTVIKEKIICAMISFSVNVYAGLLFYTKLTLAECLLWFCFCTSILLLQEYSLKGKNIYLVLASLVNVFMLWTHMRTIAIVAALIFSFTFYCILLKNDIKKFFLIGIILCFGIICLTCFKKVLKIHQYSFSTSTANELSGQIYKLEMLVSYNGIKNLILNIIGRIWYLGNSTFLIFYFGIFGLIRKCIKSIKENNKYVLFYTYILLSIIFSIGISSVFMLNIQNGRRDTLFYGRYNENVIAPILVLGLMEIIESKYSLKKFMISSLFQLIGAIVVRKTIIDYKMHSCLDASIPGFYYWIKKENFSNESYLSASLLVIMLVALCIFFLTISRKKICKIVACILLCFFSITLGYRSYEISDTHKHDEDYYDVYLNIVNNLDGKADNILYCYNEIDMENHYSFIGVDRLQFLLKDKIIHFTNLGTEELTYGAIIITRSSSEADKLLREICSLILENKEFNVYEYK